MTLQKHCLLFYIRVDKKVEFRSSIIPSGVSGGSATIQSGMTDINPNDVGTPQFCTVDFCLIPIGTSTPSVSKEIADVQRFLKKTNVKYSMHSAGTSLGKVSR